MSENLNDYIGNTDMTEEKTAASSQEKKTEKADVKPDNPDKEKDMIQTDAPMPNNTESKLKEVTGKEREQIKKEQEMDLKELIYWLKDMVATLFGVLTLPNGKLVDFSDKDGRERQTTALISIKKEIGTAIADANVKNEAFASQLEKAIPTKIDAVLAEEDRKRIDWLQRFWKYVLLAIVVNGICFALAFVVSVFK